MATLLEQEGEAGPLTPQGLEKAASRFRDAGYRSEFKYLIEAKRKHVEDGHEWTKQLELSLRDCKRALERGIGAPKRAGEMRLAAVADQPDTPCDTTRHGLQGSVAEDGRG